MVNLSKKIWQTLVLLALLVGFPLISWLYLRDGINFRIQTIQDLHPKTQIADFYSGSDSTQLSIWYPEREGMQEKIDLIQRHFQDRDDLIFQSFDRNLNFPSAFDSLEAVLHRGGELDEVSQYLFLIDSLGAVRSYYRWDQADDLSRLVEHIAFLLPPEPERDFDFRREPEK